MARPLRLDLPGAVHHVVARGTERRDVFLDDGDRAAFLDTLTKVVDRFGWEVLAFCLLSNHYHLLLRTPEPNLARGMRQLNGVYAQRFNRRYDRVGPLWQGRYQARLVQTERYLLAALRYVVRNPVRHGFCESPRAWRWGSHPATLGLCPGGFLATRQLFALLADAPDAARRIYRMVTEGTGPDDELPDEIILGDPAFAAAVLADAPETPEIPRRHRLQGRPPLSELLVEDGPDAIRTAYVVYGYNQREIAQALGCHYATVSRRLRKAEAA
jgi:putative transposase